MGKMIQLAHPLLLALFVFAPRLASARTLPPEVSLNSDAGRGNLLFLTLHFKNGRELPCIVDTGSPVTILDKSLEPYLGKRIATTMFWNFGVRQEGGVYAARRLYLGNTQLKTTPYLLTLDFKSLSKKTDRLVLGILGMDCLSNYCIQLDFDAGKLRFLAPDHAQGEGLGSAFPITYSSEGQGSKDFVRPFIPQGGLFEERGTNLLIDTGYRVEGALATTLFHEARQTPGAVDAQDVGRVWFPQCQWNGQTYTNLLLGDGGGSLDYGSGGNLLGLQFLARHLVTLNFPRKTLYLKPRRAGPLTNDRMQTAERFVNKLKQTGQLPGWPADAPGTLYQEAFPDFEAFDGKKTGDPAAYHYRVIPDSEPGSWKLEKAWKTLPNGNSQTLSAN